MATIVCTDYRRTDTQRTKAAVPYWLKSQTVVGSVVEDRGALCFSFPRVKNYLILNVYFQVLVAFTTGTVIDIGSGTIATDAVTTDGNITIVDADEYIKQGDITIATPARYGSTTGNTSDWLTAAIAGSWAAPFLLTGAATTVPVVYATIANAGDTIVAGTGVVHMRILELP